MHGFVEIGTCRNDPCGQVGPREEDGFCSSSCREQATSSDGTPDDADGGPSATPLPRLRRRPASQRPGQPGSQARPVALRPSLGSAPIDAGQRAALRALRRSLGGDQVTLIEVHELRGSAGAPAPAPRTEGSPPTSA